MRGEVIHRLMHNLINSVMNKCLEFMVGFLITSHREWIPRIWSNREIQRFGPLFTGDVINVSAWKDSDKDGGHYREYFPNAASYTISNYGEGREGSSGLAEEKILDLSKPYTGSIGQYDLVFSHTVIEHIYPSSLAFENLCQLSRDCIITVVPFIQQLHGYEDGYSDYYRYSPFALQESFQKHGFETLYTSWNSDHPLMNVYIFHVASKKPNKYTGKFPKSEVIIRGTNGPGFLITKMLWPVEKNFFRKLGEVIGCQNRGQNKRGL